ncbi:NTP transferase domain-containing protein [Bosea vaviloviae]|uniref:4-diphosphocytidyl-2C-methyl-D-erythritol kinase n=1 Tax=Bosea vaviloviae TaxID=1526658 RepID=A0A0N0M8Q8_9HYPH|nr:molybdopterin-binding/glycosyltransferase family 2 protein [Bosea vaviloviae]KPH75499.1 4-diphosphocytidyl-2C-methyl-D-erythritol kinase [Bosea vaviloviae]
MKFGPVPLAEAAGSIAAHTIRAGETIVKKGAAITAAAASALAGAGVTEVVAVRFEPGDIDENAAATRLAEALAGRGVVTEAAFTGRVNLFAQAAGVLTIDAAAIDALNRVDEAITVATLPPMKAVVAGEMIGTVKIIPYGLPAVLVEQALSGLGGLQPVSVSPYRPLRVAVISTLLPGLKPSVVDKTLRVMAERLAPAAATLSTDRRVPHEAAPLARAIATEAAGPADIIVVFGASAITDRRDVIPQALLEAGGRIEHLGMPVDPGNLLLIGDLAGKPVIGAPGCARSPKENGFDWVLQRCLAGIPVRRSDIQAMGVGGLLMEIVSRPQPRAPALLDVAPVAGIVLAAGRSTRMGQANKLLQSVRGKPMLRHAVEAQLASRARPVIVVTGHQHEEVSAALTGLDVSLVHNPDFASGLASSVKAGLAALPDTAPGVVVSLGDMPNVTAGVIDRLAQVFADSGEALAVVPTLLGQRGNPVLLARALFAAVGTLDGDQGARRLLDAAGDAIVEGPLDDPAIALDVDTPEALAGLQGSRE